MGDPVKSLGKSTLLRVFLRSLFLQAAWNPKGMQSLGFAYALYPALARLYPDPKDLALATERHLCCFNSHPYLAATIVGGALHHEERIARGEESPELVNAFKQSLMGPLAALGDGFFWLSLRPACGAFSALLALAFVLTGKPAAAAMASVAFYLVSYNAVHIAVRARLFVLGHRLGDKVVDQIAASRLPIIGHRLRIVAAASAGAAGGLGALALPVSHALLRWAAPAAAALFTACYLALARGVSLYLLAYAVAVLALCIGVFF
jgi:PTS system mannose-specific IID component